MSFIKPTKQITLTWKGVSAVVKDKLILNNSEGYCQPGEMLAIMGPSGAGKTTLLSLLSKRNNPSLTITGEVSHLRYRSPQIIENLINSHFIPSVLLSIKMTSSSKLSPSEVPLAKDRNS
jgi:ABC-type molybdenum transport system ATPase subunit/photorepair protein PhrA